MDSDLSKQRKRVARACDRCKMKKVKCCGSVPCTRCIADDAVCLSGTRAEREKRMVSRSHVERLYRQQALLMKALRELWRERSEQSIMGDEEPSIHDIVAQTGVLENSPDLQISAEDLDWDIPTKLDRRVSTLSYESPVKDEYDITVNSVHDRFSERSSPTHITGAYARDSPGLSLDLSSPTSSAAHGDFTAPDMATVGTQTSPPCVLWTMSWPPRIPEDAGVLASPHPGTSLEGQNFAWDADSRCFYHASSDLTVPYSALEMDALSASGTLLSEQEAPEYSLFNL